MAKQAQQKKLSHNQRAGLMVEENTIYDDSLLPPAEELVKLNSVSADIVPWIMHRTEIEQNARIKFNENRMELAKKDFKNTHRYDLIALFMAFVIVIGLIIFSFYLILNNKDVLGTVFAGGTMALIVSYFLKTKNIRDRK